MPEFDSTMPPLYAATLSALHPIQSRQWVAGKAAEGEERQFRVEDGRATAAGRPSPAALRKQRFPLYKKMFFKAVSDDQKFSRYCLYSAWRNWA